MDWNQTLTIVFTTLSGIVGVFLVSRRDMQIMDSNHREDMKNMDDKLVKMDEKWERLFSLFVEKFKG
jgi:uncharacterized membrane protein SpoIIM required for sporulation